MSASLKDPIQLKTCPRRTKFFATYLHDANFLYFYVYNPIFPIPSEFNYFVLTKILLCVT